MTASDTPPPLTDEELAHARRRQSDPLAQTSLIEARLLAEVDRLRAESMPRAEVAKAMDALTRAAGEAIAERDEARAKLAAVQKVIEPSDWKPLSERHPEYFTPDTPEEVARKKGWKQGVDLLTQRIRAALGETGGTDER